MIDPIIIQSCVTPGKRWHEIERPRLGKEWCALIKTVDLDNRNKISVRFSRVDTLRYAQTLLRLVAEYDSLHGDKDE